MARSVDSYVVSHKSGRLYYFYNIMVAGARRALYAELAVSSLAMAVTIASTHCAYPLKDGQAELA